MTDPASVPTPDHIDITDRPVRDLHARCHRCLARVDFGTYEDPGRADQLLDQWVARHLHVDWAAT